MELKTQNQLDEGKWAIDHYKELQEKYHDKWVVIRGHKVIASGKDVDKYPDDFIIFITSGAEIF